MDENDLKILRELRKDSRISLVDINKKTGIPVSTVFDKLSKMEKKGLMRYAGLYNYEKMGHSIRVNFLLNSGKDQNILDFLSANPKVNNLYRVNNKFDFYIEAVFRNFSELEKFTESISKFSPRELLWFHTLEELRKEDLVI